MTGLGLMDYSLLVGVVQRRFEVMERSAASQTPLESESVDPFQRDGDGGMHATVVEGPGTYYMGIIDVLQHWNWEKKIERFLKIAFKWEGNY
jgi:1-phosphatidylinositol-4-phosphate 5-kinase